MTTPDPALASPSKDTATVPDVDVAAGIERLMGNRTIYLRALARFRGDYRVAGPAIGRALANADLPLARRLVHTLKGAAGMIEAGPLHGAAMALEEALRLRTPAPGTPLFDALLAHLDAAPARCLHTWTTCWRRRSAAHRRWTPAPTSWAGCARCSAAATARRSNWWRRQAQPCAGSSASVPVPTSARLSRLSTTNARWNCSAGHAMRERSATWAANERQMRGTLAAGKHTARRSV
ncbi:Hpt domain-containing protein [Massilia sp. Se16.2.3]|nr:Hpt domain-containing protein [Massilia sp. Se16.2.3]